MAITTTARLGLTTWSDDNDELTRAQVAGNMATLDAKVAMLDGSGKLVLGATGDANLYRSAANALRTDGSLQVVGVLRTDSGLTLGDAVDITIGTVTGTKIGQAGSKIGVYGATPVGKWATLTAASAASISTTTYGATEAGVINNTRTRLNDLESRLQVAGWLS